MKTLNLNEKSFQLENDIFKFLHDYIERINAFVAKNQIDTDLHQDILQRLADKLSEKENQKGWITQKIAIQIVNDLWEPEEIFAEEEFSSSNAVNSPNAWKDELEKEKAEPFYEKFQKSHRSRPQETAIFLWVCGMFGQGTGWNVRFWRGVTLFASYIFLASGMGNAFLFGRMCYFLLALIFPITEKNYGERSVFNYFLTQVWDLRLLISNSIKFWFKSVKRILGTAIPSILKRLSKLFWPFRKCIKICFLIGRTGFLLMLILALSILAYYFRTWWVEHHIDLMTIFPSPTKWGVLLGMLSAFLLFLGGIGALFRRKLMNNTSLILALASGIFALSIAFISGGKVLSMLHTTSITTLKKKLTIPLPADQRPLIFSFAEIPVVKYLSFEPFMWGESLFEEMMINYLPYEGKEIKAEFHYQIKTSDPVLKAKIEESLADPIYELSGEKLLLSLEGQQLFDAIVPFIPMNVSLDLYIPKDWKFNITNSLHANNLHKPEWTKKWGYYDPYYDGDTGKCSDWISYDEKENAFFCPLERNPSSSEKREIIEREIRKKADELSLLEGLNRERSFSHDARRYRELDSVLWKNDHRVIAKLSDKFFNLFMELEVEMNEKGELKILKSTLKELEQKGMMNSERIKLYQGWEELKQKGFTRKEEESWSSENVGVSREEFNALLDQLNSQGLLAREE